MAELKISELSAAVQVLDSDILPMTSGTSTVKVSAEQIKDYVADSLDVSDSAVTGSYVTAVSETNGKVSVTKEAADVTPTQNSTKMVTSGGVYSALGTKQDTLTFDNAPASGSDNPVKSGGIYSALDGKQDTLTFDNTPTQNSDNPVKSGGVYAALQDVGHTIKDDTTTYPKRSNLKFSRGFFLEDDSTNDATIIYKNNPRPLYSFATATDAELAEMIDAYYDGYLTMEDIKSVWSVGDEREVTLSAISGGSGDFATSQTVHFVIYDFGGKTLTDNTECLAIIGQKEALASIVMDSSGTSYNKGWPDCEARAWCNSNYKNALPQSFSSLFKEYINLSDGGAYRSHALTQTEDYFALPCVEEVLGTTSGVSGQGTQFKYFETAANIPKVNASGTAQDYWTRSVSNSTQSPWMWFAINSSGVEGWGNLGNGKGAAPFGCI